MKCLERLVMAHINTIDPESHRAVVRAGFGRMGFTHLITP
jgi:hypothetical protein